MLTAVKKKISKSIIFLSIVLLLTVVTVVLLNLPYIQALDVNSNLNYSRSNEVGEVLKFTPQSFRAKFSSDLDYIYSEFVQKQEIKADVIVKPNELFYRHEIEYPINIELTGVGDTSWENLAMRFYNDINKADIVAAANPALNADELKAGVKVIIPQPQQIISIAQAMATGQIKSTPVAQLFDATGKVNVTAQEFDLFVRVIASESGANWDYKGNRMIAESIINRVRKYKKNIFDVIMQPEQYSVIDSGSYLAIEPNENHRQAARDALYGNIYLPADVEFFCTKEAYQKENWFQSLDTFDTYDNTVFLKINPERQKRQLKTKVPVSGEAVDKNNDEAITKPTTVATSTGKPVEPIVNTKPITGTKTDLDDPSSSDLSTDGTVTGDADANKNYDMTDSPIDSTEPEPSIGF